jgi:excisionase family DNA binding protein
VESSHLLTVTEAATRYRVARSTLYELVRSGRLAHYTRRVGKVRTLLDPADVEHALGMARVEVKKTGVGERESRERPAPLDWRGEVQSVRQYAKGAR